MAICRSSPTGSETTDYWVLGGRLARWLEPVDRRSVAALARTRLGRRSNRLDRVSLGGGTERALCRDRRRIRPAKRRCYCVGGQRCDRCQASYLDNSDRVHSRGRSGRRWYGCEFRLGRQEMSRASRSNQSTSQANALNFCMKLYRVCVGWRYWLKQAISVLRWSRAR